MSDQQLRDLQGIIGKQEEELRGARSREVVLRMALREAVQEIVDWSVHHHIPACGYSAIDWDSDSVPAPDCWCRDVQRWGELGDGSR